MHAIILQAVSYCCLGFLGGAFLCCFLIACLLLLSISLVEWSSGVFVF